MAPRATYRKFQLRLNGKLLTPEAELLEMRTHFETLYQADHATSLTHVQLEEDVPVTPEEILESIQNLQAFPRLASPVLPRAQSGKSAEDQVAPLVAADLTQRWMRGAAHSPCHMECGESSLNSQTGKARHAAYSLQTDWPHRRPRKSIDKYVVSQN